MIHEQCRGNAQIDRYIIDAKGSIMSTDRDARNMLLPSGHQRGVQGNNTGKRFTFMWPQSWRGHSQCSTSLFPM